MRLKEQNGIAAESLPMTRFRDHLRLGSGFGEDDLQDGILEASLRAAIAAIEARTGKVLLERTFIWQLEGWRALDEQALPVAPVNEISWVKTVTRSGDEVPVDLALLVLVPSEQRPVLRSVHTRLPMVPSHGYVEIGFEAGFAAEWDGLPADLAQAVLILAAHFYEQRHEVDTEDGALPSGVARLIARFRTVRILGGRPA